MCTSCTDSKAGNSTSQYYFYRPSTATSTNPSVGTNGATAPTSSTEVAGINPTGNLQPLLTDAAGNLLVSLAAGPISPPLNVNLADVGGAAISLGQALMASSIPMVIASDQVVPISATALPLPAGASTSALQTSGNTTLSTISTTLGSILLDLTNGTQITQVSNFPATQPVSGTVTANQGAAGASPWPVTDAELAVINTTLGSPFQAGGSIGNTSFAATQATAANLNATVVGPAGAALATAANQASQITQETTTATNTTSILANQTNGTQKSQAATPTALTVTQAAVTVGTSAVRLTVSGSAPSATRVALVATPDGASTAKFYIGSASVTATGATRGIQIVAGQSFIANSDAGDYYIVSDAASQTVEVMEQA